MAHTSETKGLVICTDGTFRRMTDISGNKINEAVGGYFDVLSKPNITLWCHDEGMFLYPSNICVAMLFGERLFGNVVVTGGVGEQGETLPIPPALIRIVSKFLFEATEATPVEK